MTYPSNLEKFSAGFCKYCGERKIAEGTSSRYGFTHYCCIICYTSRGVMHSHGCNARLEADIKVSVRS